VTAAHAGAHADVVVAAVQLRLDQDRPGVHVPEVGERLVERGEGCLITALGVAYHVAVTHGVVGEFAPQRQVDDAGVEPEAPVAIDAGIQVKGQRHAVAQRVADGGALGILDARVQEEHPLVDVHVGRAHFEHAL